MTTDIYLQALKQYWGYENFRGIQREIIESIANGNDTLGLMPTGGGKSITFQVPALCTEGVCIVVTPLIALMKDQVVNLRHRGICASAIYNSMQREEIISTLENAIFGGVKILYVSPERLGSELFQKKLSHIQVSFITVDEAHCISQWGYDFRPSYLNIANMRVIKPDVPILALTATATPTVVNDIQRCLAFRRENVFRMSYERKNLAYIVRNATDKQEQLLHILSSIEGCAIVYVRSRRHTREIADMLTKSGISALAYHAGLEPNVRDERQQQWHDNKVRVMVATNAFGMGIDKPDVRLVVHIDCPDSLEAYFQEAGRAGRDGAPAYAVLLYDKSDTVKLQKRIADNFPDKDYIKQVYEHLAYFFQIGVGSGFSASFEFDVERFCHTFKHFPTRVNSALKILTHAGYISYEEEQENRARVHFLIERNDFYKLDALSKSENDVIIALLRNYGGLFSDFNFISESYIAQQIGLQTQQVYMILKNLSQKHILQFIPQSKSPRITYTRSREDMERIFLPPEVYEQRRDRYIERVKKVIAYATNDSRCRSRQLLEYFGETTSHDCGQCDVCANQTDILTDDKLEPVCKDILQLLKDGEAHTIQVLHTLPHPTKLVNIALEYLLAEEIISQQGASIILRT